MGVQVAGLIGKNGILPAGDFLRAVRDETGPERYWFLPTVCWLNASDGFLQFLCVAGALLSLGLIAGLAPAPLLLLLWILYLSLVNVGQDFLEFQWDNLLLEAGFLAIFLAPLKWRLKDSRASPPSALALWLLRWLLFRLMFSSGMVKLASGDLAWRHLTALNYHYETQPLPTWIGWYAHQLPGGFQKLSAAVMFMIELAVPFSIFAPRRLRLGGCGALVVFQLLIAATGNYCFFNLLTLALCLLLIDDKAWAKPSLDLGETASSAARNRRWIMAPLAGIILMVTSMQMVRLFRVRVDWPSPFVMLYRSVAPFRTINSYGLFAVMTRSRDEIIVEGSNDGTQWLAYEFKWKPGDLKRRPGFVAPHQPRLDWQMWFAALGSYRENPWFMNFMVRLLEGRPEVLRLLEKNPFPGQPPRFLRAVLYDYRFTDFTTRRTQGTWWRREAKGLYCPVLSRR